MKRISQTVMKEYIKYLNGEECGEVFRQRHITKELPDQPTEAMQLGNYFEFKATGYFDKKRGKPEPVLLKSGTNKGKPNEAYSRAERQAVKFKAYLQALDLKQVKAGERIEMETADGITLSGLLDIRAKSIGPKSERIGVTEGEEIIIDLKYSGMLWNKWEEGGYHPESFMYRQNHHIQPAQYKAMTGLRFFFFVFGTTPAESAAIFEVDIPDSALEFHQRRVRNVSKKLEIETRLGGFRPRPNFERCRTCQLFKTCEHAARIPDHFKIEVLPEYNQHLDE